MIFHMLQQYFYSQDKTRNYNYEISLVLRKRNIQEAGKVEFAPNKFKIMFSNMMDPFVCSSILFFHNNRFGTAVASTSSPSSLLVRHPPRPCCRRLTPPYSVTGPWIIYFQRTQNLMYFHAKYPSNEMDPSCNEFGILTFIMETSLAF